MYQRAQYRAGQWIAVAAHDDSAWVNKVLQQRYQMINLRQFYIVVSAAGDHYCITPTTGTTEITTFVYVD